MKQKWLCHPKIVTGYEGQAICLSYCDMRYSFVPIPQEETSMQEKSASLIVKFKIKAHLNINS